MSRVLDEQRCSVRSAALAEPLAGTAPVAQTWLVLESPGAWPSRAVDAHPVAGPLAASLGPRIGVLLVRRVGHHADEPGPRRVWVAQTRPGATSLRSTVLFSLDELAGINAEEVDSLGDPSSASLALVCTNSRRDLCCAIDGRGLATELDAAHPGQVWEASHLGGHRFAPTALVLPWGLAYGRATASTLTEALAGRVVPTGYRGRSTFAKPAQTAEAALRLRLGETDPDALDVTSCRTDGGIAWVTLTHRGIGHYLAHLRLEVGADTRPASCGGTPEAPQSWQVIELDAHRTDARH